MSKQDWLDYFEAVNGRSDSAEEIAQALAAGEFQEEVVVPETPQAPEFVAAPTAPVEEPVAAPQAPEFVAAPTAPVEEPVAAPQAPEFVAAPAAPAEEPVAAPVQEPAPQVAPANGPAFQQAPQQAYQQPTQAAYQQASLPRSTRTTLSCPTKSIWCSRWWLLELVPFSFETSNGCRKSKST